MKSSIDYQVTFTKENNPTWITARVRYNCENMAELEELVERGPTKAGLTGITEYQTGHHGVKIISWTYTKVIFDNVTTSRSYSS